MVARKETPARIVFVASEGVPFSKTGGLADVVGALPKALAANRHPVTVILPRYQMTEAARVSLRNLTLPLQGGLKYADIQEAGKTNGVRHLLVDCPEYFDRSGLYQMEGVDYPDNAERFAAFCLASIEAMKRQPRAPDVIHCHDWQTALVPIYLRTLYAGDRFFFHNTSVLLTIHNLGYQGIFPPEVLSRISLRPEMFTVDGLEYFGKVNLLKGGILYSNAITTVSKKYSREIQTSEFGFGLEGVLAGRRERIHGILNGVDYEEWSPGTDRFIAAHYTPQDLTGKQKCKRDLLESMGFRQQDIQRERPVLGIVSRFASQKGFDLIAEVADRLLTEDLTLVALGSGDRTYEKLFLGLARKHPDKVAVKVAYDNVLAHKIEAGADMFLMPSRYEPCGLNQIYSMKYGTAPIVRATGGLDDTVEPFDGTAGTGFKFGPYSGDALMRAVGQALKVYRQREVWRRVMTNGMAKDFSWDQSAKQFSEIYRSLTPQAGHL